MCVPDAFFSPSTSSAAIRCVSQFMYLILHLYCIAGQPNRSMSCFGLNIHSRLLTSLIPFDHCSQFILFLFVRTLKLADKPRICKHTESNRYNNCSDWNTENKLTMQFGTKEKSNHSSRCNMHASRSCRTQMHWKPLDALFYARFADHCAPYTDASTVEFTLQQLIIKT